MIEQDKTAEMGKLLHDYKSAQQKVLCLEQKGKKVAQTLRLIASALSGELPITVTDEGVNIRSENMPPSPPTPIELPTDEEVEQLIRDMKREETELADLQKQWDKVKPL